jgi:hypothetical protein
LSSSGVVSFAGMSIVDDVAIPTFVVVANVVSLISIFVVIVNVIILCSIGSCSKSNSSTFVAFRSFAVSVVGILMTSAVGSTALRRGVRNDSIFAVCKVVCLNRVVSVGYIVASDDFFDVLL